MNLSNRLTFSLMFSVILVVVCAFVATPAMAIVTVKVTGVHTEDDTTTDDVDEEKLVVTLTYSPVNPPDGTKDTLTSTGTDNVFLSNVTVEQSGNTITITVVADGDGTTPDSSVTFTVPGYAQVAAVGSGGNVTFAGLDSNERLTLAPGYLAGKGYLIIANHIDDQGVTLDVATTGDNTNLVESPENAVHPTMPNIQGDHVVRRSQWTTHVADGTTVPDLYAHFQEGHRGTIDVTLTDDAGARVGEANARTIVINEVMWARDESQVGGPGYTREQWIEVFNNNVHPIEIDKIKISFSNAHPAPPNASTDRLSTNSSYTNVWDITGKGQHGHPGANDGSGRKEFISMQRARFDGNHHGWISGSWGAAGDLFLPNYRGTPSRANAFAGLPGPRTSPDKDTPAKGTFVVNEIGNMSDNTLDWIEIKNITGSAQSLKNWALSKATAYNNESEVLRFPDKSIPAYGILLIVNKDPIDTPLAAGNNIKLADADQAFGADGNVTYIIVDDNKLSIPNDNDWVLILRSGNPWNVKDGRSVWNSGYRTEDVAGPARIVVQDINAASPRREKNSTGEVGKGQIWQTKLFPLNGQDPKDDAILRHNRTLDAADGGTVHIRNTAKQGYEKEAFHQVGYTGIGYDRGAPKNAAHGGTPGYDNGVAKSKISDIPDGGLIVSELMLTTDNGRYPQWIELHNTSKTRGISLGDPDGGNPLKPWRIAIENHNSGTWQSENRPLNVTIRLSDWFSHIPPNQTVLIVSTNGRNSGDANNMHFPGTRVADIFKSKKGAFKMANRRDMFLNAAGGFTIQILDSTGAVVDAVGNLDGKKENIRVGIGLDDPVGFDWPTDLTEEGDRTSLIRLRDDGVPRAAVPTRDDDGNATDSQGAVIPMGMNIRPAHYAWVHAVDTPIADAQDTWYGSKDDFGTPGHTASTPLPVSLSFFRPVLENGEIVIRWTTESELDNAGFNILRSDTRNGEYKKVNTELIKGAGTTGERTTYKWVDATAKPNIIYYYQIEDVSFAGERQTLATTKLKGLISAKNKATTTWGDLKSQDNSGISN